METKIQTACAKRVEALLNQAAVLELIDPVVPPDVWVYEVSDRIDLNPSSEDSARKLVGALMRLLKSKPVIEKPYANATTLNATFKYNGVDIRVCNYKGRKCAVVKKTIVHEAEPEKIVPAKAAWVEEREELVCDLPSVEAEVTPAEEGTV